MREQFESGWCYLHAIFPLSRDRLELKPYMKWSELAELDSTWFVSRTELSKLGVTYDGGVYHVAPQVNPRVSVLQMLRMAYCVNRGRVDSTWRGASYNESAPVGAVGVGSYVTQCSSIDSSCEYACQDCATITPRVRRRCKSKCPGNRCMSTTPTLKDLTGSYYDVVLYGGLLPVPQLMEEHLNIAYRVRPPDAEDVIHEYHHQVGSNIHAVRFERGKPAVVVVSAGVDIAFLGAGVRKPQGRTTVILVAGDCTLLLTKAVHAPTGYTVARYSRPALVKVSHEVLKLDGRSVVSELFTSVQTYLAVSTIHDVGLKCKRDAKSYLTSHAALQVAGHMSPAYIAGNKLYAYLKRIGRLSSMVSSRVADSLIGADEMRSLVPATVACKMDQEIRGTVRRVITTKATVAIGGFGASIVCGRAASTVRPIVDRCKYLSGGSSVGGGYELDPYAGLVVLDTVDAVAVSFTNRERGLAEIRTVSDELEFRRRSDMAVPRTRENGPTADDRAALVRLY